MSTPFQNRGEGFETALLGGEEVGEEVGIILIKIKSNISIPIHTFYISNYFTIKSNIKSAAPVLIICEARTILKNKSNSKM